MNILVNIVRFALKTKWIRISLIIIVAVIFYKTIISPSPKSYLKPKTKEGKFHSFIKWFGFRDSDSEIDLDSILVKALVVHPAKINPSIQTIGSVDFLDKVDIVSKTAGNIQEIKCKEGEKVAKGQILLQIDTLQLELERKKNLSALNSAQSALKLSEEKYSKARDAIEIRTMEIEKRKTQTKEAKAELEKMRATFSGKQILYKEGGISKEEFESAQTMLIASEAKYRITQKELEMSTVGFRNEDLKNKNLSIPEDPKEKLNLFITINTLIEKAEVDVARSQVISAQAALESTEELIRATTIRSPIDGVVAYVNKHMGEYINPGGVTSPDQAIMVLVNINKVYAKFNIRETDMTSIRQGMALEFTADVHPGKKFVGKIDIINPIVDPKTHTLEVKALIKNENRLLTPGLFLRGTIFTGEPTFVLLVPTEALLSKETDNAWIFTVNNGMVLRSKVKVGRQFEDKTEITDGLSPGTIIAVEKLTQLQDGMKISPQIENALP